MLNAAHARFSRLRTVADPCAAFLMYRIFAFADGKRKRRDGQRARDRQVSVQPAVQHHGHDHAERPVLRGQPDGLFRRGLGHRPRPGRVVPAHEKLRRQVAERAPVRRVVRDRLVRVLFVPGERGGVHKLRQGTSRENDFVLFFFFFFITFSLGFYSFDLLTITSRYFTCTFQSVIRTVV